ncbi:unnamed protein product [Taenia asiatica]|uniref:Uncharacterized protein n=1 Tax=Taenia asiatica TaxID=60517 RepID=A0A0R3VUT5_TAEAS|nr:unnamed protein product [Taenia asiatica]
MDTSLRLDTFDYLAASSPNHVVGAWRVGGGDGVQSHQAATHGSSSLVPLEERHKSEYSAPLSLSSSRGIVSPGSMSNERISPTFLKSQPSIPPSIVAIMVFAPI